MSGKGQDRRKPKYAAALQYRPGIDAAPVVIASGRGEIAAAIVRLAEEAGVPQQAEPVLAKLLSSLPPGTPIPEETYQMVASILAFIWRLDRSYPGRKGNEPDKKSQIAEMQEISHEC